jgi:hypothetical protein
MGKQSNYPRCLCEKAVECHDQLQSLWDWIMQFEIPEDKLGFVLYHDSNWSFCPFCGKLIKGDI